MNPFPRRLLAAISVGAALAAPLATTPAQAAAPEPATVTHTRLILNPTDRGYEGSMQVTITWQGLEATPNISLEIVEPIANSFADIDPSSPCSLNYGADNRRTIGCGLDPFQPGQSRTVTVTFRALTPAQVEPLIADGGRLRAVDGLLGPVSAAKKFAATLRGTDGEIKNPVPYVQDAQTDMTLTSASSVTLVRQEAGYFLGRLPMTLSWRGDAPNYDAWIGLTLPAGWFPWGTDPSGDLGCTGGCSAPGGELFDGDVRSFDMLIYAPEDAVAGSAGTIDATAAVYWGFTSLTDVSPADNSVTFSYTVAG